MRPRLIDTALRALVPVGILVASISCDAPTRPRSSPPTDQGLSEEHGASALTPYVAVGVSIEEGRQSFGTDSTSQVQAWPVVFARLLRIPFSQPLIRNPGCPSPVLAPLSSGATLGDPGVCAPNVAGVVLPANDVGVTNASTDDALNTTPEIAASQVPFRGLRYSRILPSGATQVTAMLSQHPKLVTVDLGGAEMLPALFGDPDEIADYATWQSEYDQVIAKVRSTGARGMLIWFTSDLDQLAGMRHGHELYADRAEFAARHITVDGDCNTSGRNNVIYIADLAFVLIGEAADAEANGDPWPILSCSDVPGTEDDVLTPSELSTWRAQALRMEAHIRQRARDNGYGFFRIEDALMRVPGFKPPFSLSRLLDSDQPFGPLMSLDDLHPNRIGHSFLAVAAVAAFAQAYLRSSPHVAVDLSTQPMAFPPHRPGSFHAIRARDGRDMAGDKQRDVVRTPRVAPIVSGSRNPD